MSEIKSRPYKPDPLLCCERCVFGTGDHAANCRIFRRCICGAALPSSRICHNCGYFDCSDNCTMILPLDLDPEERQRRIHAR